MSSTLIKLILLAEEHQQFSRAFERQFQVDKVRDERAHRVENDILGKDFANAHRVFLLACCLG